MNREGLKVYLGKRNIGKNIIAEYKQGNLLELTGESAWGAVMVAIDFKQSK